MSNATVPKEDENESAASRSRQSVLRHAVTYYMTMSPHSIGSDQKLSDAHALMEKHQVRHLPVMLGKRLAGLISQRDVYFAKSIPGVDLDTIRVRDAMSPEVYCVGPSARVEEVAREMGEHRYGCAVVMDRSKVLGIFTSTDAVLALARLLSFA